ncbi:MAG: hypothetical protein ACFHWX_07435 [Bacteroidota bacterium]
MKKTLVAILLVMGSMLYAQEGSVGIGTQTPNEKAVLHLVAPNNDQGFLVPKLTTAQRTSFASQLTPNENGMMIYDSDLNQFYFWLSDHWEAVGAALQAGNGVEIVNGVINNTGDTDASDDFSGDWADLANVPAAFVDGTDDVDDADNDPTNELELPSIAVAGQVLKYNGTSWVADTDATDDGDTDAANELQDLNLTGDILSISGIGTPTQVDLSAYIGTNTDEQDLQFTSGQISLSGDPDNTIIDLSGYDSDASDDFTGDWADLLNVPAEFADGMDEVDDADNDPTNEIELPATAGTNDILVFDGSSWIAGTDQVDDADNDPNNEIELPATAPLGYVLKFNDAAVWSPAIDETDDADNDPNNELQDLNLSSNILTITGIGSPTQIDLAPFAGTNTDEQDLQFSGGQITLSGDPDNTIIDLSGYDEDVTDDFSGSFLDLVDIPFYLDTDATDDFSGSFLDLTDVPVNLDTDATDDFDGNWLSLSNRPAGLDDGDDVDDADASPSNEIQDLQFLSGQITLTNDPGNTVIDLSGYDDDVSDDFSGSFLDLADVPVNLDTDATDDFDGNWSSLSNRPAGLDDGDDVDDADASAANELQDLSLSGNTLSISLDPTPGDIDLSPYLDNTDALGDLAGLQDQVVKHNGLTWVAGTDEVDDADNDPNNEIELPGSANDFQVLQFDGDSWIAGVEIPNSAGLGQVLKFNDSGNWGAENDLVNDADASPTNEIQDLELSGNTLTLSSDPTTVDLSAFMDNTDALADLLPSEGDIAKYLRGSWVTAQDEVDDADNDPTNEMEFPTSAGLGQVMKFTDANTWEPGSDLVNDADSDPTNEIELPATATPGQVLKYSAVAGGWSAGTDLVDDADNSPTNEIEFPTTATTGYVMKFDGSKWAPAADDTGSATSPWSEKTDANGDRYVEYSAGYASSLNMISTVIKINRGDIKSTTLTKDLYKSAKIVLIDDSDITLYNIDPGVNGQEIIIICLGSGINFDNSLGGSNIFLPSTPITIRRGGSLTLMYVDDKDLPFQYWVPVGGIGSPVAPK